MSNNDFQKFLTDIDKIHIHGKNMLAKIKSKKDVSVYEEHYRKFYESTISKSKDLESNTIALNSYKDKVSKLNKTSKFTAQSKFESSIIEEFLCVILKNEFGNDILQYGSIKAYSSLYFNYSNKDTFKNNISININNKDQDVAIYRKIPIDAGNKQQDLYVPIVCIECKTYIDKTMLEGSVATASKIKNGNPNCLFLIVSETYDVANDVNIETSDIDNIYILRKGKRKSKTGQKIQLDVIEHVIETIKNKLDKENIEIEKRVTDKGYLRL